MKAVYLMLMVTVTTIFSSCEKEGPTGKDGNANVVSKTFSSSSWREVNNRWLIDLEFPAITQEIMNTGAVLVYLKINDEYAQLPLTFYPSELYSTTIRIAKSIGVITVIWSDSDLLISQNPGRQTFKVVVIAASQMGPNPNVDFSDYQEVISTYNIEN